MPHRHIGRIAVNASDTPTGGPVSIPALLRRNARKWGARAAYREKAYGIWQTWTWTRTLVEVEGLAMGLMALDLQPGDHVAVIGRNRPELYMSMVSVQMAGGVPVPLYQDAVAEEMAYVLEHCGARYVIVGDQEQVDKVNDEVYNLEKINEENEQAHGKPVDYLSEVNKCFLKCYFYTAIFRIVNLNISRLWT